MKHAGTAFLVVMLFSTLGLWGLAQQKNGSYAARLRELEGRYVKIDEDHRTLASLSDRHQRRINQLEKERGELTEQVEDLRKIAQECDALKAQVADLSKSRDTLKVQLSSTARERDELRGNLSSRTRERDAMSEQMQAYTRELQGLLGRMETALANPPRGNTTEAIPTSRRSD